MVIYHKLIIVVENLISSKSMINLMVCIIGTIVEN